MLASQRINRMQRKLLNGLAALGVLAAAITLGISAYGAFRGDAANAGSSKVESGAITIQMKGLAFPNGVRTITPGTKVTWKNLDDTAHTVTSTKNTFASSNVDHGKSYSRAFAELGTYNYICTIHPYMKGTIKVVLPYGKG